MDTWFRPNGLTSQFEWYPATAGANALGLKQIHHTQAGTTVSKFGYAYDLVGRIQTWTRQLDSAPANRKDWTLAYSRSGELTGVIEKNASTVETRRASWNYDPAGNWYATGDATATTHRSHNSMNRLSQIGGAGKTVVEGTLDEPATVSISGQPAQVSSLPGTSDFKFQKEISVTQGTNNFQITATDARGNARTQNYSVPVGPAQKTYEYDLNGNLLREKDSAGSVIRSFEWDAADRLKAVVSGSRRIEWTYNSQGQKVLETTNGTASKRYFWDGSSLLLERTPTGVISKRFYADGEQRVGGTDAGNYYYTRDHLGSVREVVNQAGVLVARYDYDAYGKRSTLSQSASFLNGCSFGYTGHLTLPSLTPGQSELVLTHFRAYDPQLGRWLSPDPIGEAGGMNLYGYVGGDPVNGWDVLGLVSKTHYPGKDGTWRVDSEVNGPGKGGSVHINIGKNKFHFDPNTQSWSNRDAPNTRLPKNVQCEMNSDSFKQKLGNAVNRVNEEGGGFGNGGSGISKYLPAVAALGIVLGLNESANAMGKYVEALRNGNWAGANEAAVEAAQSLPGVNMQQADLLMKLQDAIEKTQSGGNEKCQD